MHRKEVKRRKHGWEAIYHAYSVSVHVFACRRAGYKLPDQDIYNDTREIS